MKTQINPRKRHHRRLGARLRAGFSLVELLIVIAVIGIIAAIAIPNISNVTSSAQSSTYQRNAQNIVSTYSAAIAAGAATSADRATAVGDIIGTGLTPASGPFSGKVFKVEMSPDDANSASTYVDWDATNKMLIYKAAGGVTALTLGGA